MYPDPSNPYVRMSSATCAHLTRQLESLGVDEVKANDPDVTVHLSIPDTIYEMGLPEGVTMETVRKIREHDSAYRSCVLEAVGSALGAFYESHHNAAVSNTVVNLKTPGQRQHLTISVDPESTEPVQVRFDMPSMNRRLSQVNESAQLSYLIDSVMEVMRRKTILALEA